jgi:serine protease AprX
LFRRGVGLSLFVVVLVALLPGSTVAGSPGQAATVQSEVWQVLQAQGQAEVLVVLHNQADLSRARTLPTKEARGRYVYETLWTTAQSSQRGLRASLDARGIDYQPFYIVDAILVRAGAPLVQELAARADVARIELNPWVRIDTGPPATPSPAQTTAGTITGVEPNLIRIHADDVWALGFTGQGAVVGGQDTGYDWDHAALKNQYRGWNGTSVDHDYNWHDAIHSGGGICGADSPEPCDDYGHGTHTMGIMVGDDGGIHRIGVAPDAQWIGCRNMDEGVGSPATYMECFEFFLAPYPVGGTPVQGDPALAPDVVNNSWSCPPGEGCVADTLEASVDALRQAGIVVVVSASNSGPACSTVSDPPAIYQQAFSVGAFSLSGDQIASFSSRGPVTYGGETYVKPDLAAPGVSITSSLPGGGYGGMSGTSMAAPHVGGAVALLLSAAPAYRGDVDALEAVLTGTAEPKTTAQACSGDGPSDVPNNVWGWGILDTLAAVESGVLRGTVTDAAAGSPVAGAEIVADPPAGSNAISDSSGHFVLALPADTYSVTAQAKGYLSHTISGVTVASRQMAIQDFSLEPLPLWRIYLPLTAKLAVKPPG